MAAGAAGVAAWSEEVEADGNAAHEAECPAVYLRDISYQRQEQADGRPDQGSAAWYHVLMMHFHHRANAGTTRDETARLLAADYAAWQQIKKLSDTKLSEFVSEAGTIVTDRVMTGYNFGFYELGKRRKAARNGP